MVNQPDLGEFSSYGDYALASLGFALLVEGVDGLRAGVLSGGSGSSDLVGPVGSRQGLVGLAYGALGCVESGSLDGLASGGLGFRAVGVGGVGSGGSSVGADVPAVVVRSVSEEEETCGTACVGIRDVRVSDDVRLACEGGSVQGGSRVVSGVGRVPRGKNYEKNQAARERKRKAKKMAGDWRESAGSVGSSAGSCGRVPSLAGSSGVETVVTTASEAKAAAELSSRLRESLARRRLAENEVATLKAERLAKSLKDDDKCRAYDQMKEYRLMQWTNQAKSGSQKSWKECVESGGIVSSAGSAGEYHFKKALNDMTLRVKPRADAFDKMAASLQRRINSMEEGEAKKDARFELDGLLKGVDKEVERLEAELSAGEGLRCYTPCVDDYDSEGNFIERDLFY